MLEHVRDNVFPFIKGLEGEGGNFAQYMQDAVFIIPKASLLVEAVAIIDEIFAELERERQEGGQKFQDLQGDLYEYLLSEIATVSPGFLIDEELSALGQALKLPWWEERHRHEIEARLPAVSHVQAAR